MAAMVLAVFAAACNSSTRTVPPTTLAPPSGSAPSVGASRSNPPARANGSGPVDVLYAGSLVDLMDRQVGPGFHSATGYSVSGVSGGSGALANEIKGRTQVADVFISASPAKDRVLEGPANGDWLSWYATFATSPLVIGYNPNSRFAHDLKTMPWYKALAQPGILVGRTDPATDPKGALTVTVLDGAASAYHEPALSALAASSSDVFPENSLVGRLQAGQLDAGFFYGVEAAAAGFPTVPLTGVPGHPGAAYTVSVLNGAPHPAAAKAFLSYLLGAEGSASLGRDGMDVVSPPRVSGNVPATLSGVVPG